MTHTIVPDAEQDLVDIALFRQGIKAHVRNSHPNLKSHSLTPIPKKLLSGTLKNPVQQ